MTEEAGAGGIEELIPRHELAAGYRAPDIVAIRHYKTIEFLQPYKAGITGSTCLDVGELNPLTDLLRREFQPKVLASTQHDLDYCSKLEVDRQEYHNIFCFEVIEHLCDPLQFLEWCRTVLADGGHLFLSTPQQKPNFLRNKEHHFHEFNRNELDYVIRKAGLQIVESKLVRTIPWHWCFKGIRPILRFVRWNRTGFFVIMKME